MRTYSKEDIAKEFVLSTKRWYTTSINALYQKEDLVYQAIIDFLENYCRVSDEKHLDHMWWRSWNETKERLGVFDRIAKSPDLSQGTLKYLKNIHDESIEYALFKFKTEWLVKSIYFYKLKSEDFLNFNSLKLHFLNAINYENRKPLNSPWNKAPLVIETLSQSDLIAIDKSRLMHLFFDSSLIGANILLYKLKEVSIVDIKIINNLEEINSTWFEQGIYTRDPWIMFTLDANFKEEFFSLVEACGFQCISGTPRYKSSQAIGFFGENVFTASYSKKHVINLDDLDSTKEEQINNILLEEEKLLKIIRGKNGN